MLVTCMSIRIKEKYKMVAVLSQISLRSPGTVARQAPVSMGFPRQEYRTGLPCPFPEDLPNPGIEPPSPVSPTWAGRFFTARATWEMLLLIFAFLN